MKIIEKIYSPKVGNKISWIQSQPYKLGDDNKPFPFEVQILNKQNQVLETKVVNIPASVLKTWQDDTTITNYILSVLGLALDLDNTIDLVLSKLNSGSIVYESGTQEENNLILQNYANFVALQIESYKEGSIEIDDFLEIQDFNVNITFEENTFTIKEFVKSLVNLTTEEKEIKLNNCVTAIETIINQENEI